MPTYEYLCRACGDRLEVVQAFADDPLTVCEACGGELRKVFSAAGLIFKGSGWHIKDYSASSKAPSGSSAAPSSDAKPDAKPDARSDSKSDSKSDAKSDAKPAKDSSAGTSTTSGPAASSSSD